MSNTCKLPLSFFFENGTQQPEKLRTGRFNDWLQRQENNSLCKIKIWACPSKDSQYAGTAFIYSAGQIKRAQTMPLSLTRVQCEFETCGSDFETHTA